MLAAGRCCLEAEPTPVAGSSRSVAEMPAVGSSRSEAEMPAAGRRCSVVARKLAVDTHSRAEAVRSLPVDRRQSVARQRAADTTRWARLVALDSQVDWR